MCAALLLGISLLVPALINRQPILYSDSVGYFHAGYAALEQLRPRAPSPSSEPLPTDNHGLARQEKDGISTARSVYYGLFYVVSYLAGGIWAPIAGQVFITLTCLLLAGRRALEMPIWARLGALLAIGFVSGLSFFADTVMPDLFAGLMLLAAGMLFAYGEELPRWETGFWLAVVLLASLFHKSHLLILVLLVAGLFLWRKHRKAVTQLSAAAALGLAGHYAVDLTVLRLTGRPPIATPFFLARLIGDGTAQKYLAQACPTRHFATCDYLDRMPMTENEFLWSRDPARSAMGTADRRTRTAITAESSEIVLATILRYPGEQIVVTAKNVLRQFVTVGVGEFRLVPRDSLGSIAALRPAMARYRASPIAGDKASLLDTLSTIMLIAYIASLAGAAWLLLRGYTGASPAHRLAVVLMLGIGANAAVCGAISGVFDRYQGRVSWLALMAFAILLASTPWKNDRQPRMARPGGIEPPLQE